MGTPPGGVPRNIGAQFVEPAQTSHSLQENYGELEGLKARIGAVEVKSYVLP